MSASIDVRPSGLGRKRELLLLAALLGLALLLRLGYLAALDLWQVAPADDGIEYDLLATSLAQGQGFALLPGVPYGFRPPGFPAYLALLYGLAGRSYAAVRLANALLGALTCLPVYLLGRQLWRWQAGLLAGLGVAAHPLLIYFSGLIYPESLMLCLVALALLVSLRAARSTTLRGVLLVGLLWGLLSYLRPTLLLIGAAQMGWIWLRFGTLRRRVLASAALAATMLLVLLPWTLRNVLVFDQLVLISTNGGVTLWASNNALADGGWVEPGPAVWPGPDGPHDLRGWPGLSETASEARFQAAARQWIGEHPAEFLRLLPHKLVRGWSLNFGNEARPLTLPTWLRLGYTLFVISSLAGAVLALRAWRDTIVLYIPLLITNLTTLIYYGSTRQSALMLLPLILFCALALDQAAIRLSGLGRRRDRRTTQAGAPAELRSSRGSHDQRATASDSAAIEADVAIVIVSWNTRELLLSCLRSLPQALGTLRAVVWVVDNGSRDGSVAAVQAEFPSAQLIANAHNPGFAAANNQAIVASRSRYVLLLNSDAEAEPDSIVRLVELAERQPELGMVGGMLINPDGTFQASFADFPSFHSELLSGSGLGPRLYGRWYPSYGPQQSQAARAVDYIPGACMLVRRAAIEAVGLMDEDYFMYSEEIDWCVRVWRAGWQVWYLPTARIRHYGGQSTRQVHQTMVRALYRSKVRFFRKHYGALPAATLQLLLVGLGYAKWLAQHARSLGQAGAEIEPPLHWRDLRSERPGERPAQRLVGGGEYGG